MITEPSLWVTTTVFKLIAPTKISMVSSSTVSLRDIVPSEIGNQPRREFNFFYSNVKQATQAMGLFCIDTQ